MPWLEGGPHLQLSIHQGGCQVAQLHPAASFWQRYLSWEALGAVLHHRQRCAFSWGSLKGLCRYDIVNACSIVSCEAARPLDSQ